MRCIFHKTDQFDCHPMASQSIGYLDDTKIAHSDLGSDFLLCVRVSVIGQFYDIVQRQESPQTLVAVSTQMSSEEEMMPMWAHLKYLTKLSSTHVGLGMEWAMVGWLRMSSNS